MSESPVPEVICHIAKEHQQEVIVNAVLNIEAHAMTIAGAMMVLESLLVPPKDQPPALARETYISDFHRNVEILRERYSAFGQIDTI